MNQDDIQYSIDLLEEAINDQDWDSVIEAKSFMEDFLNSLNKKQKSKYDDDGGE